MIGWIRSNDYNRLIPLHVSPMCVSPMLHPQQVTKNPPVYIVFRDKFFILSLSNLLDSIPFGMVKVLEKRKTMFRS